MPVIPADRKAPPSGKFGVEGSGLPVGAGGATLFAESPTLGAGAVAAQVGEGEALPDTVGPLDGQCCGPVEFDGDGGLGIGEFEGHGYECGPRRTVELNGAVVRSSEAEIAAALAELPGWVRSGDEIVREFACTSFADAIAFVVRIGFLAEAADHHPDLDIRWRTVRVALTTHDVGGLSSRDFALAAAIEATA